MLFRSGTARPTYSVFFGYQFDGSGAFTQLGAWNTDDGTYGIALTVPTFIAATNGFRLVINGGGVSETGGGVMRVRNLASGDPMRFESAPSTGYTGSRYDFISDQGTPTAGWYARFGHGAGATMSTVAFGISSATATRGRLYVNDIPIGWNIVTINADATVAIGDRVLVQGGGIVPTLPPVPTTVSTRDVDIMIIEINGGVLGTPITVTAAAGDLINGAATALIGLGYGSMQLCHDGDGTNWRIVGSHLL